MPIGSLIPSRGVVFGNLNECITRTGKVDPRFKVNAVCSLNFANIGKQFECSLYQFSVRVRHWMSPMGSLQVPKRLEEMPATGLTHG